MSSKHNFQHLICPIDGTHLSIVDGQANGPFTCLNGHSFDLAKQGYINLLPVQHKKSKAPGDSSAMIQARKRFLDSGIYQPVIEQLIQSIDMLSLPTHSIILDAGCGEGYYTQQLAQHLPQAKFIGLDISKDAVKAACKRQPSSGLNVDWIVASNSNIPLQPESIDLIICIFGFHSFSGFNKVLKPGGHILLVDPEVGHLLELRQQIYEQVKQRPAYDIDDAQQHGCKLLSQTGLLFNTSVINHDQIQDLLLMTPHLFRASKQGKTRALALKSINLTVDMLFRLLQKSPAT